MCAILCCVAVLVLTPWISKPTLADAGKLAKQCCFNIYQSWCSSLYSIEHCDACDCDFRSTVFKRGAPASQLDNPGAYGHQHMTPRMSYSCGTRSHSSRRHGCSVVQALFGLEQMAAGTLLTTIL